MTLFVVQVELKLGNLIPNEALIYERVEKTIYARYRDRPEIPRWIIGGEETGILGYDDWRQMLLLADKNSTFKKEFDKIVNLYYLLKDNK